MQPVDPLMPARDVCQALGNISRVTLHRRVAAGRFPPPIQDGPRNYWRASVVQAAIDGIAAAGSGVPRDMPAHLPRGRS